MKIIQLPDTSLSVSRFIFGTASLHHVGGMGAQVAHLRAAADSGFRHFDTAPLYGFGQAEQALGMAFGAKSSAGNGITLTTKVGLYPPGRSSQSRIELMGRKVLGKILPSISRPLANWSVALARVSLDQSLKRLRRDFVELLLLHEPIDALIKTDEWQRWLEDETGNRIMHFGICGETSRLAPFVKDGSGLAKVIQAPDSLGNREADQLVHGTRFPQLTYGYLSSNKEGGCVEKILGLALARNSSGAILVSTRDRSRLNSFARIASSAVDGRS